MNPVVECITRHVMDDDFTAPIYVLQTDDFTAPIYVLQTDVLRLSRTAPLIELLGDIGEGART